jgi:hypothetical protein
MPPRQRREAAIVPWMASGGHYYLERHDPALNDGLFYGTAFWSALATLFAFFGFLIAGTGYGHASSRTLAQTAYTDTPPFHSPQQAAQHIRQLEPDWHVAVAPRAQAYDYLKHHSGQREVFVTADSTNSDLVILARSRRTRDAIVEISGPANGEGSEKVLWTGSFDTGHFLDVLGADGGLALLLFAGAGLYDTSARRRLKREWEAKQEARLERWRRYVPNDGLYGPAEPEGGFEILVPEWSDHRDGALFTTSLYRWNDYDWYEDGRPWDDWQEEEDARQALLAQRPRLKHVRSLDDFDLLRAWQEPERAAPPPQAMRTIELPEGLDAAAISERWFDYVKGVADLNAAAWAARERAREAELQAQAQAEHERELVRELERQKELDRVDLDGLLQPGHELMRGLGQASSET